MFGIIKKEIKELRNKGTQGCIKEKRGINLHDGERMLITGDTTN